MMKAACMAALWLLPAVAAGSDCKRGCAPAVEAVMASISAEEHGDSNGQQLLQLNSKELQPKAAQRLLKQDAILATLKEELQFVHIPCTFGHTVEEAGLGVGLVLSFGAVVSSSIVAEIGDFQTAMEIMDSVKGPGGVLWGEMMPQARAISNVTGCNMYYTPPMLWPADLAEHAWKDKTAFTLLRDPYDRLANEFRLQALGVDSVYLGLSRQAISQREGHLEREGDEYQRFYSECDVNGYLQAELRKYLAGDRYRGNCHLLPSAEFLKTPYGPVLPINERGIPESFNDFMELHGSSVRMDASLHNVACNDISAYSLSKETKDLIKQVYAADFDLICKHFGFCNSDEIFCHENIDNMCGGKPESS